MSFSASLSGLGGASKALDVIGNNIANSQTVGFKTSKVRFADVLAASLPGTTASMSAGAGVGTAIDQQLTQGALAQSENPLDMAITGPGFFRLNKGGDVTYTRDGQFKLGYDPTTPDRRVLVNSTGLGVTGYLPDYSSDPKGVFVTGSGLQNISIDPVMPAATTTAVSVGATLDSRLGRPLVAPFDANNPLSYSGGSGVTVYDSSGKPNDFRLYFVRSGPGNLWDVYTTLTTLPTKEFPVVTVSQTGPAPIAFDTQGVMTTAMPLAAQTYALSGGKSMSVALDLGGTVQYGSTFSVGSISQNGYRTGTVDSASGLSVGPDGVVQALYSNGQSREVAKVVLANFANSNALISQGDGQWMENPDPVSGTGEVVLDTPGGKQGMGALQGGAKEQSNVDLSNELVALIEQQRNYQANAQTFKILDQVLQSLANIR